MGWGVDLLNLFEVSWLRNDGVGVGLLSLCFNYPLYIVRLKMLHEFRKERIGMLGGFTGGSRVGGAGAD